MSNKRGGGARDGPQHHRLSSQSNWVDVAAAANIKQMIEMDLGSVAGY